MARSTPPRAAPHIAAPRHVPHIAAPRNVAPSKRLNAARQHERAVTNQREHAQARAKEQQRGGAATNERERNRALANERRQQNRAAGKGGDERERNRANTNEPKRDRAIASQPGNDQATQQKRANEQANAGGRRAGDRALRDNEAQVRNHLTERNPALVGGSDRAIRRSVLRNQAIATIAQRTPGDRTLAHSTFRGHLAQGPRFHDRNWRRRHRAFVIGWVGPLFWPYAYDDFVEYTFVPYAYDTFWPYAYDDVYAGIFGPYAFARSSYANATVYGGSGRRPAIRVPDRGVAQVCSEQASALTQWPVEQIEDAVKPDESQRSALQELQEAARKAVDILQAACPTEVPATPPARLTAMRQRLTAMAEAVAVVRPALDRFYDSLNDEQKAQFNALAPAEQDNPKSQDLTRVCSGQAAAANLPIDRVRQAVRPTEAQRAALDALDDAAARAADILKANCEDDESLTPPGRLGAMEQRLKAMLQALDVVQPVMERFYGSLSDEQKERFNRLDTRQARR
jgi:hypothetical protein